MNEALLASEAYKRVVNMSRNDHFNIIGAGYLPARHQSAIMAKYKSVAVIVKFRIKEDCICYKIAGSSGQFGVVIPILNDTELQSIINQSPLYKHREELR